MGVVVSAVLALALCVGITMLCRKHSTVRETRGLRLLELSHKIELKI